MRIKLPKPQVDIDEIRRKYHQAVLQEAKDAKIEFSVIAAPKYSVEVTADNWKRAEEVLDKVSENVVDNVTKSGGHGSFKREK